MRIGFAVLNCLLAGALALSVFSGGAALASDAPNVDALVKTLVANVNKGDVKAVAASCASRAAVVDGFPPYAWQTCADWMNGYLANNKAIAATLGTLTAGKVLWSDVHGNNAYAVYPVAFTDTQNGKRYSYKGTMTVTMQKTPRGWVFTGIASAWTI